MSAEANRPSVNLDDLREAHRRLGILYAASLLVREVDQARLKTGYTALGTAIDEIERLRAEHFDHVQTLRTALFGLLSSAPRSDERNRAIARAEQVLNESSAW